MSCGKCTSDQISFSGREIIRKTIAASKDIRSQIKLANENNKKEMEAFLELDLKRLQIKLKMMKDLKKKDQIEMYMNSNNIS